MRKRNKNGDGGLDSYGYKRITIDGERKLEHRVVIEQSLGRKLLASEHVHHRNHDKLDNRVENLEVLTSQKHKAIHLKEYWASQKRRWSFKHGLDYCLLCERNSVAHSSFGHCRTCVRKIHMWAGLQN